MNGRILLILAGKKNEVHCMQEPTNITKARLAHLNLSMIKSNCDEATEVLSSIKLKLRLSSSSSHFILAWSIYIVKFVSCIKMYLYVILV